MKKHFLLALLALFPLLTWAGANFAITAHDSDEPNVARYAKGTTIPESIITYTLTSGTTSIRNISYTWYDANSQPVEGVPSAVGTYTAKANYEQTSKNNPKDRDYSAAPEATVTGSLVIYEVSNNDNPIDNPIDNPTGKIDLTINTLSISKIYGQADPAPKIELRNNQNAVFTDPGDLNLGNVLMIRRAGELPDDYNYEIDITKVTYNTDKYTLTMGNSDFLKIYQVPLNREEIEVTLDPTTYVYDGTGKEPAVTVVYHSELLGDITLDEGEDKDYTLKYKDNVEPGTATVTITAVVGGRFTGSIDENFTITGVESTEFTFSPLEAEYTGDNVKPETIVVTDKDGEVVPAGNVRVVWEDERIVDVKEGGYKFTVFVTGDTHYLTPEAGVQGTFTVTPKSIAKTREVDGVSEYVIAIDEIPAQYWNGAAKTPEVKLYDTDIDGIQLVKGTDFLEPVYTNNVEPGQATVTITGTGNYTGERTVSFIINKRTIQNTNAIEISYTDEFTYNTAPQKPEDIVVKDNGVIVDGEPNVLSPETDYEIVWSDENSTDVGTYTFNIVIKSTSPHYRGKIEGKEYNIVKATVYAKADDIEINFGTTAPDPTYTAYSDEACTTKIGGDKSYGDATYTYGYKEGESPVEVTEMPTEVGVYDIIPAFGENANYQVVPVNGTLTITEAQIIAKVKNKKVEYGTAYREFELEYVSGLVVNGNITDEQTPEEYFNTRFAAWLAEEGNSITYDIYEKEATEKLAEDPVNVGKYDVKVAEGFKMGDFIVSIKPGELEIEAKDLTDDEEVTVAVEGEFVYNTLAHEPVPEIEIPGYDGNPIEDGIVTVTWENNINAGIATVKVDFNVEGSNYKGEKSAEFEIAQRPVTAVVDNYTDNFKNVRNYPVDKIFNEGAGIKEITDADEEAEAEVLAEEAGELLTALNTAVTVTFNGVPTAAGTYSNKLVAAYDASKLDEAGQKLVANYAITLDNGDLIVEKAELIANNKDVKIIFGEEPVFENPAYELDKENSDLTEAEWNDLDKILKNVNIHLASTDRYDVGEYEGAVVGTAEAGSYNVTFNAGKLTVTARPIVVVLEDQEIAFDTEIDGTLWSINDNDERSMGLSAPDTEADLNIVLTTDKTAVGSYEGAITIAEGYNDNYEIIYEAANLTITGETLIALERGRSDDAVINLLEGYNGQFVDVEIGGSNLKNVDYWYSFCLPFQTTVREISNAFGYAVVDVPDVTNTKEGKVVFKLKVDAEPIAANTLILIKLDEPRNLAKNPVKFNLVVKNDDESINEEKSRKIDYNPEFVTTDAAGNSFVPTYTKVDLKNDGEWYLQQGTFYNAGALEAGTNVKSLQGYFNAVGGAGARIFVQEADGTMTAINSATINGVNAAEGWYTIDGIKLNAQPTVKGVYINNGKKVVVK